MRNLFTNSPLSGLRSAHITDDWVRASTRKRKRERERERADEQHAVVNLDAISFRFKPIKTTNALMSIFGFCGRIHTVTTRTCHNCFNACSFAMCVLFSANRFYDCHLFVFLNRFKWYLNLTTDEHRNLNQFQKKRSSEIEYFFFFSSEFHQTNDWFLWNEYTSSEKNEPIFWVWHRN